MRVSLLIVLLIMLHPGCTAPTDLNQLAIVNARIWTANPEQPEAEAILIEDRTIRAVGSNDAIRALLHSEAEVIDAQGAMVAPGFIDAHVHFVAGGFRLSSVQLRDANSPELFIERIRRFAETQEPGTWITGGDWDHESWGGELPSREWIDAVTPNHPVWVSRLDGHMALANTLALEAAGITRDTDDIFGGEIVRDDDGEPTGLLKDNAMNFVWDVLPPPSPAQEDRALQAAMDYVNAQGVTSVQHMGTLEQLELFSRAREREQLSVRIYAAVELARWTELRDLVERQGRGDDWFRRGSLKGFVDGSLGSHTAAFFEPYTDQPSDSGLFVNTPEELHEWISGADQAGLHVTVHAIGDRAIHTILDMYEAVSINNGPRDRRFRVEHAQHVAPADLERFAALQVLPSMQPYHAIDDGRWAERVIGPERIKTTYAFRSLLDAGARIAFGSDWFVAPPTPLEGMYASVTRRTLDGQNPGGWVPAQKISVEEALKAYTIDAAYASFEESIKGSLEPGKLADLVVLDRDITAIPPETINQVRVLMTVVDGKVVYQQDV